MPHSRLSSLQRSSCLRGFSLWRGSSYVLNFYKTLFQLSSVYKTGTIHNLMHNPIKFQSPDQECSLAFRLIAASFICARIASSRTVQCQVVLCLARWSGLGTRTAVQIPCLLCGAFPRSSWFHFIIGFKSYGSQLLLLLTILLYGPMVHRGPI